MHPVLLNIGPLTFYSYGFMVALGFLSGIALAYFLAKRSNIDPAKIFDVSLFAIVGAMIGARLFYVIFFFNELKSPMEAFMVWNGGLIFYGGLLFAVLGVVLACRIYKLPVLDILDIAAPATALGYAIGRIGCFLNGCCGGVIWGEFRHPTQLYSSAAGLLILAVLLFVYFRKKFPGQIFSLGIIFYAFYRFFIEYVRDLPRVFLGLTEAQLGSIAVFMAGLILYGLFNNRSRS